VFSASSFQNDPVTQVVDNNCIPVPEPSSSTSNIKITKLKNPLCASLIVPTAAGVHLQKGIKIEAGSDVSVVVRQTYTDSESYRAIPDSQLGTEYVVGTYCSNGGSCQFAVIATQDRTSVNIILPNSAASTITCVSGQPINGQSQGSDFVVTLNELDVFYLENANDLSGTRIVANNPISVIVGGRDIPYVNAAGNFGMMVEQIPPISKWGTEFMIGPGPRNDAGDIIKIVTNTANTEVYIQGFSEFIIPKGASAIERRIDWGMDSIVRTSYPVMILQVVSISLYTTTAGTIQGTPSMVVVPSKSQRKAQPTSYVSCVSATYAFVVAWVEDPALGLVCSSVSSILSSEVQRCEPPTTNGAFSFVGNSPFSAYAYCDPGELFLVNVDWTDHTGVRTFTCLNYCCEFLRVLNRL